MVTFEITTNNNVDGNRVEVSKIKLIANSKKYYMGRIGLYSAMTAKVNDDDDRLYHILVDVEFNGLRDNETIDMILEQVTDIDLYIKGDTELLKILAIHGSMSFNLTARTTLYILKE